MTMHMFSKLEMAIFRKSLNYCEESNLKACFFHILYVWESSRNRKLTLKQHNYCKQQIKTVYDCHAHV